MNKSRLKTHTEEVHEKLKRKLQQNLCNICGKDYRQKHGLQLHMATVHNEGKMEKKKCDYCDYTSLMR